MTKDIFDEDLHYYLEGSDNECPECEKPIKEGKLYCSERCLKNSEI